MVKRSWRGAGPSVCSLADVALRQTKRVPAGYPAGENSFIFIKEALHLYMDVYMHEFPARFIFFIHMLTQVQALQNTGKDSRLHYLNYNLAIVGRFKIEK